MLPGGLGLRMEKTGPQKPESKIATKIKTDDLLEYKETG